MGGVHDDVVIRPARPEDGERLRQIATDAKAFWGYDLEWVRSWVAQGDFSGEAMTGKPVLVAEADGRAVAFAIVLPRGRLAWLDDLWVDPAWMRRGIGTRLFEAAAAKARELGAARMEWEAELNAVGFYEQVGGTYVRDSEETELGRVLPVMGVDLWEPGSAS